MTRGVATVLAGVCALSIALGAIGCASRFAEPAPASQPFTGPLWVAPAAGVPLHRDPGAAGTAVDCHFAPLGATNGSPYNTGEVGDTPTEALRLAVKEGQFDGLLDQLVVAKDEPDRRLYAYQSGGRTYQAAIFHYGPATKGTGAGPDGLGWWLESYARCDIAEYPDGVAEDKGWEVWTAGDGRRQPIHLINSHRGTDCVAGARFLEIGEGTAYGEPPAQYVANAAQFTDFFDEPYRPHIRLPSDAVASPYRHGAERLWFSPNRHRAYVGEDPSDVALWPRSTQALGCA